MTHSQRSVLPLALLLALSQQAVARTVTLSVTEDTRLDLLAPNQNRGTLTGLTIASADRPLVKFAESDITSAVAGEPLVSARLELYIATNWNNWTSGLSVEAHRLTATWTELGATWNCAIDTNTGNALPNCSPQWGGGTFVSAASWSVPHDNTTSGWVSFDVTSDVQAFLSGAASYGWLLKKNSELQSGAVTYGSREGTSAGGAPAGAGDGS